MKVSVIVPTYRSGPELDRLVASLDAQSMPHDDFEVLFVDDGSADGTVARLRAIAATRPWVRVHPMTASGWPSRPRNEAVRLAHGDYVVFADHDDTLFPDALRAAHDFAVAHDLDVVNAKEVRTNRPGWGLDVYAANRVFARDEAPFDVLSPMTPHKLYRRALLLDAGITFPERAHHMWEDNLFNVDVLVAARRLGVLADVPFYHWQRGHTSSSSSYGKDPVEYWDSVEVVLGHIRSRMTDPALARARDELTAEKVSVRVLGRVDAGLSSRRADRRDYAVARARGILAEFFPPDLDGLLTLRDRARVALLRAGDVAAMTGLLAAERGVSARSTATSVTWKDGVLEVSGTTRWTREGEDVPFRRVGGRVRRVLPDDVTAFVEPGLLDWTDAVAEATTRLVVRHRSQRVAWPVPTTSEVLVEDGPNGTCVLQATWSARIDVADAAMGRALANGVWDAVAEVSLGGLLHRKGLKARLNLPPALVDGRSVVAYSNRYRNLSLDVGQRVFALAARAEPCWEQTGWDVHDDGSAGFTVPLAGVEVRGRAELRGTLALRPGWVTRDGWRHWIAQRLPRALARRRGWGSYAARVATDDDGTVVLAGTVPPHEGHPACAFTFGTRTANAHVLVPPTTWVPPSAAAAGRPVSRAARPTAR